MFEEIINFYSSDSFEVIKKDLTNFLFTISTRHSVIHQKEIENTEEYKKAEETWNRLYDMAKGDNELKAAVTGLEESVTYHWSLTRDLFYQYGIIAYIQQKDLSASMPGMVELYRKGEHKKYRFDDEYYAKSLEEYKTCRHYIISRLGEPAEKIIDSLDRFETEAEETANIVQYIGAYHDARLIIEFMEACKMN